MNYFYRDSHDREIGPLSKSKLTQMRQTGLLSDESLVRAEVDSNWTEYNKAIVEPVSVDPVENVQSDATYPPSPKVDRLARARKFSWVLFALAQLCFLLPFIAVLFHQQPFVIRGCFLAMGGEVESNNAVTGNLEVIPITANPNVALVLGLAIAATLLALARKPFASLLSIITGMIGVDVLILFKSVLEQNSAAGAGASIVMREGFWLACALLTCGAVVQLILLREASVNEGWRLRARHYAVLTSLILTVAFFFVAPVIYDARTNVAPTQQEFLTALRAQLPTEYSRYTLVSADLKLDQTGEQAKGKAKLMLALNEPLYTTDDFTRRALEKGDNPQAYAAALERRTALPNDLAPVIPSSGIPRLYSVAKPQGTQISVSIDFAASKVLRDWSFADAVAGWSKHRGWIQSPIHWPSVADEFTGLSSRADLPRGALILEDDFTQLTLQSYVENRQTFIHAVANAETKSFQKMIEGKVTEGVLADLSKRQTPTDAYAISAVNVNFSDAKLSGGTAMVMDATIEVEQTVDLYRPAKEQPSQWPEFQPGSDYEKAKAVANRYFPSMAVPGSRDVKLYELASPAHSHLSGKLQINYQGSKTEPTISSIQWSGQFDSSGQSLVTVQSAGQNSLFITSDPNLPTVDVYREKMKVFANEINTPQPGKPWTVLPLHMGLAWIPPGTFTMGSPADERRIAINILGAANQDSFSSEIPQTQVTLTRGFWMEQNLVTQAQWEAVMGTTLEQERDKSNNLFGKIIGAAANFLPPLGIGSEYPIHYIAWDEAMEFCYRLTAQERAAGRLPKGYEYTLPTEARWEYACRAGTTTWYYTGSASSNFDRTGWYAGNSQNTTQPVGQKLPNAWGLYDMLGNVWEWCQDWYATYPGGNVTDPIGPSTGTGRVIRGGSVTLPAILCHSTERNHFDPAMRSGDLGFRVMLAPKP